MSPLPPLPTLRQKLQKSFLGHVKSHGQENSQVIGST